MKTKMKEAATPLKKQMRKKADITRERILTAAKRVFAWYPYPAASLRMIGKKGGFNHELIRHHFPSKAALFETIVHDMCENYYQANITFLQGLASMGPEEGFSLYLNRFMEFHYANPEALRIMVINMAISENPEDIPGYRYIPKVLTRTRNTFKGMIPITATAEEVERFLNSFNNLLINYLAADYCQARTLGLKHTGIKYREWVKTTLLEIFLPHLKRLIGSP